MAHKFRAWLHAQRDERPGETLASIAARAGVSDRALSAWGNDPSIATRANLNGLASALGVPRRDVYEAADRMDDYPGEAHPEDAATGAVAIVRDLRSRIADIDRTLSQLERALLSGGS